MTEHVNEALECLKSPYGGEGAITHAILALAEQQRISNLIALAESGRTTVNGARQALRALYDGSIDDGTAHMFLRPEIAQTLGIGNE